MLTPFHYLMPDDIMYVCHDLRLFLAEKINFFSGMLQASDKSLVYCSTVDNIFAVDDNPSMPYCAIVFFNTKHLLQQMRTMVIMNR